MLCPLTPCLLSSPLSQLQWSLSEALPWSPDVGRFHLFRVEVEDVTFVRYDNRTGDQTVVRWPAGVEVVRRGTSATTVGEPQPTSGVLV